MRKEEVSGAARRLWGASSGTVRVVRVCDGIFRVFPTASAGGNVQEEEATGNVGHRQETF